MGGRLSNQLLRGSAAGALAVMCQFGLRFALTPCLLGWLGSERFGLWILVFSLLSWSGMHRIGWSAPVTAGVSKLAAADRHQAITPLLRTFASAGVAFALPLVLGFGFVAPALLRMVGIDGALHREGVEALRGVLLVSGLALVFGVYQWTLEGLGRFGTVRAVDTLAAFGEATVVILVVPSWGVQGLVLAYALRTLGPIPCFYIQARRAIPGLSGWPGLWDGRTHRDDLRFGAAMQGLGVVHLASTTWDRLVVTTVFGLVGATTYDLAKKLLTLAQAVPSQLLAPLVPTASHLSVVRPHDTAGLVSSATRGLGWIAAPIFGVLLVAPEQLVMGWLGSGHDDVAPLASVLAAGGYVHLMTGPVTAALRGLGRPSLEWRYGLLACLTLGVTLPLVAKFSSLMGVAWTVAVVQGLSAFCVVTRGSTILGLRPARLVWDALRPLGLALALSLLAQGIAGDVVPTSRLDAVLRFLVMGGVTWVAGVLLGWKWILRPVDRAGLVRGLRFKAVGSAIA